MSRATLTVPPEGFAFIDDAEDELVEIAADGTITAPNVGGPAGGVGSVNGETGTVVLDAADVGAEPAGAVAAHEADTSVHGIADTTALATDAEVASAISLAVTNLINGAPGALDTLDELAAALGDDASFAATVTSALAGKQPIDADLTAIGDLAPTNDDTIQRKGGVWVARSMAQIKTDLALVKGDVGLGNVDNTADTAKPVSTAQQTALDGKAAASHTHTKAQITDFTHSHPQSEVTNLTTDLAAKAPVSSVPNASYRVILDSSGSHVAARVAGTYGFAQGQPLAISGTGTLYPLNTIYIDDADYPTLNGVAPKLRVRAQLYVNDVAPTGNFTVGLHPITRPATSGGAALLIYTIGAAVAGSTVTQNTPAADSSNQMVGADFALPADGHYVLGLVTTATVAASSLVHISAALQMRNN